MYSAIVRSVNNIVMVSAILLNTQKLTNTKINWFSIKTLPWILLTFLPCFCFFGSGYNLIFTILSFVGISICVQKSFDFSLAEGMMFTFYFMIMAIIPDLISSSIVINFLKYSTINKDSYFIIFSNLLISVITYFAFNLKFISNFTISSQKYLKKSQHKSYIFYVLLATLAIGLSYYIVIDIYKSSKFYFTTNIVIVIFVLLIFIYINKIIKYNQLETKNSILYDCMSNIENYQEEQDLKIHEYKNQLSKITALTDDKEIIKRIEEILDVDLNADTYLLGKIKNIPKSELKSLIYYKLLVASRANLNLIINVSNEINKTNYKLDRNQYKSLSNLIGVFFDNAIEAAKESKERELYFEIYDSSVGLTILISNTYSEKINLSKIGTRGYTTKGKNRGKGLYLVKKLLDKKNRISIRTLVNDNQFVQKIIVKKE